jgi:outer membrane protein assembly factor BamE (lipoprotein component of BamABCDE complex)
MKKIILVSVITLGLCLTGCIRPVKPTITQGNIITQATLDQLQPGMDINAVTEIMGTPVLVSTFSKDRIDYVYTKQVGYQDRTEQRITCYFKDKKLVKVVGNLHPSDKPQP